MKDTSVRLPGIIEFADGPSAAMEPIAKKGYPLKFDTFFYAANPLQRLDVVIFALSSNESDAFPKKVEHNNATFVNPSFQFVKRVLGLPGETIQFKEDGVLINNEPLKIKKDMLHLTHGYRDLESYKFGAKPFKIPDTGVFVISDNIRAGFDSRHFGIIPLKCIFGKLC